MTTSQYAAELQVLLEGVPLPASRGELLDYARRYDSEAANHLRRLPERAYDSLDEVGEALSAVQPAAGQEAALEPRAESGKPPGGEAYLDSHPEPGATQLGGPPGSSPQQQVADAAATKKRATAKQQAGLDHQGRPQAN